MREKRVGGGGRGSVRGVHNNADTGEKSEKTHLSNGARTRNVHEREKTNCRGVEGEKNEYRQYAVKKGARGRMIWLSRNGQSVGEGGRGSLAGEGNQDVETGGGKRQEGKMGKTKTGLEISHARSET